MRVGTYKLVGQSEAAGHRPAACASTDRLRARAPRNFAPSAATRRRRAFTLFEVLLALAILVGAIATLGELLRSGLINAERARDLSRATLICEGKMAQIVAGIQLPEAIASVPVEDDLTGDWIYSVDVADTASPYLLAVTVTVQRNLPAEKKPVTSTLVRWVKSPLIQTTTSSSDTGSGTSSSSTSTGGTQ